MTLMKQWEKHGDIWRLRVGDWTRAFLWLEIDYCALVNQGDGWTRLDGTNRRELMRRCEQYASRRLNTDE